MRVTSDPEEQAYAWVIVWACFGALAVIFGVAYSFAAFFASFGSTFSAQRADIALVFGLSGLVYFTLGIAGGMLSDRFGPRVVCCAGMVVIACGLVAASYAQSMATVYLAYGVGVGVGIALVYTPAIACVQPWFHRRRGLAAGIASSGIGAGTLVVPLLAALLIAALQWRDALRLLALGVLVLGLSAAFLLRAAPNAARGGGSASGTGNGAISGVTLRAALHDRRFWWLYLVTVSCGPTMFIPFAHVSVSARDIGVADAQAVGLVGMIGIGSLLGRFLIGGLADRFGRKRTLVLMLALMATSYLAWLLAGGYPMLAVFALWFGLSYGGIVAMLPALCMDLFGGRAVAGIIGALYSGAALGNLLGPVVAGAAFDRFGSYRPVMAACTLLMGVALWAATRLAHCSEVRR